MTLTPTAKRLLYAIRDYTRMHGFAPTFQELADQFGIKKVSTWECVRTLIRGGWLHKTKPHAKRAIKLTAKANAVLTPAVCPHCGLPPTQPRDKEVSHNAVRSSET